MITVVLIGSGNVAYHLAHALNSSQKVNLIQRYARTDSHSSDFPVELPLTHDLEKLPIADVYLLAIKDDAIKMVSSRLDNLTGLVVHTSGTKSIEELQQKRKGVLYPVQSLSIDQKIEFRQVPLAIEANSPEDVFLLLKLGKALSDQVYELSSAEREKLHIAAVFANNFSNYMFSCAAEVCNENQIPFEILKPMILETGKKVQYMSPLDAQTGPARRGDQEVIDIHLCELQGEQQDMYRLISMAISKLYKHKQIQNGKKL